MCEDKKKVGYSIVSDNDFSVLPNEFTFGTLVTSNNKELQRKYNPFRS
jgi:hypothetical protein